MEMNFKHMTESYLVPANFLFLGSISLWFPIICFCVFLNSAFLIFIFIQYWNSIACYNKMIEIHI